VITTINAELAELAENQQILRVPRVLPFDRAQGIPSPVEECV
jgi:hypothetical protein